MQYMIRGLATWQTPVLHGAVRGKAKRKRISLFDENAWIANGVEEKLKRFLLAILQAIRRLGISSSAQAKYFLEEMTLPR